MKLKFDCSKGVFNQHGTQAAGEPWNGQAVKGWKIRFIDLIKANRYKKELTRNFAKWRFILYRPSGACYYLDVTLTRAEQKGT